MPALSLRVDRRLNSHAGRSDEEREDGPHGLITRHGYHYAIFLPGENGTSVNAEVAGTGGIRAETAETTWCRYAWPVEYGSSGHRTFLVNQTGDVVATETETYSGDEAPRPGAAFQAGDRDAILGLLAIGIEGQDGNVWRQVN